MRRNVTTVLLLGLLVVTMLCLMLSGCRTIADINFPDGTAIHVDDNKSREGFLASWTKTPDGYAVMLSSQHSGADVEALRLAGKVVDKVQIIPFPMP